ncbi:MAG: cell division protein FtsA [Bacteroidia bacterium]|nr:cell division protein FtsA [Bacteroidia bacterium]
MDERYIASIDLGSSKTAVSVAEIDGSNIQIVYYREIPSRGVRHSVVFNPKQAAACVKEALGAAEEELKIKILQLVVGLPRFSVQQQSACASIERSDKNSSITQEEVDFLKNEAADTYPLDDRERDFIYGIVPQSFSADDYIMASESDIVGMVSETLDGNFKVFIGKKRSCANVDMVMNLAGKAIAGKYFIPEVTGKAVLTSEERENGVALIEIGGGVTSVTIYHKNILCHYSSIPFGGKTITSDIRLECGTSERLSENIKLAYGVCMPEKLLTLRDKIIQIENKEDGSCKQLTVKYLSEVITCRMKEILEACFYKIQESGYADRLRSGIVLTGGGAMIPNLAAYAKELSGYNVRAGYPLHKFSCSGCPEVCEPSAAASIGMILAAKENELLNCLSDKIVLQEHKTEEEESAQSENPADASRPIVPHPAEDSPQQSEETSAAAESEADNTALNGDAEPIPEHLIPPEEFGEETKKKKERTKKKPRVTWTTSGIGKFLNKVSHGMEGVIDGLYNDMEQ